MAIGLAAGRLVIGAGIWLAPRRALTALGFDPEMAEVRTLGRLAASRDLAAGGVALAAIGDRDATRSTVLVNAAVDAGDALAFAIALVRREGSDRAALGGLLSAGLASTAAVLLARRLG